MFYLIIPPIIIVISIALLIIFLARVVPKSEDEAKRIQLEKNNTKVGKKNSVVSDSGDSFNVNNKEVEFSKDNNSVGLKGDMIESIGQVNDSVNNFKKESKNKKSGKSGFKIFIEKLNPFKKKNSKGSVILPGINRVDGIKRVNSQLNFTQSNEENLSRMDRILLDSRNIAKNSDTSNKEESELVRQISVDPRNPESYRRLGDFYVENDRLNDARECYKYVLRLDPKHRRAQLAMKRLDRILG